jgi:hypothetical protein
VRSERGLSVLGHAVLALAGGAVLGTARAERAIAIAAPVVLASIIGATPPIIRAAPTIMLPIVASIIPPVHAAIRLLCVLLKPLEAAENQVQFPLKSAIGLRRRRQGRNQKKSKEGEGYELCHFVTLNTDFGSGFRRLA